MYDNNLPIGALNDSNAPFNQVDLPTFEVITNFYINTNGKECGFEVLITKDHDEIELFYSKNIDRTTLIELQEIYQAENENDAYNHYNYQIKFYKS